MIEQDEQPRIARHIIAAGLRRAFHFPQIGGDTVPVPAAQTADHRKPVDPIGHPRLKRHDPMAPLIPQIWSRKTDPL